MEKRPRRREIIELELLGGEQGVPERKGRRQFLVATKGLIAKNWGIKGQPRLCRGEGLYKKL